MKILLFLALLFFSNSLISQTLSGYIKSGEKILPYVNIFIDNKTSSITDSNGYYEIQNINEGEYEISISSLGYKSIKRNILISNNINIYDFNLEKKLFEIEQVVVTGTLKESYLKNSPVKVEVINDNFIKKISSSNLMEVVENINGLQNQIDCGVCGTNSIKINGMEGPYSLVLIDGMPIMSSLSSVYGLNGIPSSIIKQIEIVKGPSSTLYGSEAVAGVINIITKKPRDLSTLDCNFFITTHLEKNIDILIAPKFKFIDLLLSGNFYHMKNFIDHNNDNFNDVPLSNKTSLFNKISVKRKSNKTLNFSAKYYNENRFGGVKEWSDFYRGSDSVYGESIYSKRLEFSSFYELPFREKIDLQTSFNYHHQDSYYGPMKYEAWQNLYYANLIWNKKISDKNDLIVGFSHKYQTYIDSTISKISEKSYVPGLFIQDQIKLNNKISTLLGIRFDHHINHGLIYSPRISLKYNLSDFISFRLNSGTGFRIVNLFTEDHAALTGSRDVEIINDLQPEESFNINLNYNHFINYRNNTCSFDIDLFYNYFTNKIIPDYETNQNKIIYDNLDGYSISRGFAFSLKNKFMESIDLNFGFTYLDVFSIDPYEIKEVENFVPKYSGVYSIEYSENKFNYSVIFSGKLIGPMKLPKFSYPFNKDEFSSIYSINNIKLIKKINGFFTFYFSINNLFNVTQESPIINYENPFEDNFDTSYMYGELQTRNYTLGINFSL
ncbi:MAG: TonB-dependent receptor [Flavobacteriales bacterium]|nr:TonB-dependent receptor [Flavobacteriales bacterium]